MKAIGPKLFERERPRRLLIPLRYDLCQR